MASTGRSMLSYNSKLIYLIDLRVKIIDFFYRDNSISKKGYKEYIPQRMDRIFLRTNHSM